MTTSWPQKQNRNLLWLPQLLHIKYKPETTDKRHFSPDFCFEIKCWLRNQYRRENINKFELIDLNCPTATRLKNLTNGFNFDNSILLDDAFSDRDQFEWQVFVGRNRFPWHQWLKSYLFNLKFWASKRNRAFEHFHLYLRCSLSLSGNSTVCFQPNMTVMDR